MGKENFPVVHGFRLMNEIGGGGFSVVYRAVNFEEQITAACKVVSLTRETTPGERESLEKEIKVQSGLKHPNVLEFMHGLIVEPPDEPPRPKKRKRGSREVSADDDNKEEGFYPAVYMVLELAGGGDLFDKIEPEKGVETDVAHHYFRQLALGLEYLHQNGVCHRDLKPENILLSSAGVLKISDFGLCGVFALVGPNGKRRTRLLSERCGSYPYMAPELIGTEPYEAEPIDIWGIGVILYALLSGNTPWEKADRTSSEYTRYLAGEIFNLEPWCHFERDALGLITGMLTPDPAERMTMQDIFHHPWILRENELTQRGAVCVAEALTQNLRSTGALDIATPPSLAPLARTDRDGDQIMLTAMAYSQFTQTLMLFSQTAAGQRYTPGWTRFYANVPPSELQDLVLTALKAREVKHKILAESGTGSAVRQRIRIGGYDTRRLMYRGLIEFEAFEAPSVGVRGGTFCVMTREKGNPISWRQIWKNLIISPSVEPVVLRKPERA